jgi:hypothetical protein
MAKLTGPHMAGRVLLAGLALLAAFHLLVLLGVVPGSAVWGGRVADSPENLLGLEVVGVVVTLAFALIVAGKVRSLGAGRRSRFFDVAIWVVFGYFVLNVVGNVASSSPLEQAVFIPVSVVLSLLALRLAVARVGGARED